MTLVFWNDGDPKIINNPGKVILGNETNDVIFGAVADVDLDIYDLVDMDGQPGDFQKQVSVDYVKSGTTVIANRVFDYVAIEEIRDIKKSDAKQHVAGTLAVDDWRVIREADEPGRPMDPDLKQWRKAMRQQSDDFEVAIGIENNIATLISMQPTWPDKPE